MRLFSIFLSLLISMPVLCSMFEKSTENKAIACLVSKPFEFREKFGFDLLQRYSEEGFAVGTLVATPDSFKTIETIKKNDLVLDHHGASKKVLKVATRNVSHVICFVVDDQEIFTGCNQLFDLFCAQQWCKACDLKNYGIESFLKKENVKLYQLTVEGHIFSIEKSNIIVHNVDAFVTPLLWFLSYTNPVTAVIGTTVGVAALAYSAYKIHQAGQAAYLSRMVMQQKQQEQINNDIVYAIEKDVVKNQEAIVKTDQINKDVQSSQNALERRTKTFEKIKKDYELKRASVSSDNGPMINRPEEPKDEEEKKRKEEEEFKKKHPKGRYDDAGYHKNYQSGSKSPRPLNGQKALDNSFEVPGEGNRRIAVSDDQFVVLTETIEGLYHGHVRTWGALRDGMQRVLKNQGLVTKSGKII